MKRLLLLGAILLSLGAITPDDPIRLVPGVLMRQSVACRQFAQEAWQQYDWSGGTDLLAWSYYVYWTGQADALLNAGHYSDAVINPPRDPIAPNPK